MKISIQSNEINPKVALEEFIDASKIERWERKESDIINGFGKKHLLSKKNGKGNSA